MANDDFDFHFALEHEGPFGQGDVVEGSLTIRARRDTRSKGLTVALWSYLRPGNPWPRPLERGGRSWCEGDVQRVEFRFEVPDEPAFGYQGWLFGSGFELRAEVDIEWEENAHCAHRISVTTRASGLAFGAVRDAPDETLAVAISLSPFGAGFSLMSMFAIAKEPLGALLLGAIALPFNGIAADHLLRWRAGWSLRKARLEMSVDSGPGSYREAPSARPIVARIGGLARAAGSAHATLRVLETKRVGDRTEMRERVASPGEVTGINKEKGSLVVRFPIPATSPLPYSFLDGDKRLRWTVEVRVGGAGRYAARRTWEVEALPTRAGRELDEIPP